MEIAGSLRFFKKMVKNIKKAVISITNRCNMKCKMCSIGTKNSNASGLIKNWSSNKELEPEEWRLILDNLKITNVSITGVEPLLYPKLDRLLQIIKPGRKVTLLTNGFLIEKWFNILMEYIDELSVSIDGASANVHDKIRGVNGAFEKVMKGVTKCREFGKPLKVNYSVLPINVKDIIPFYNMFFSIGARIVFNHFIFIHPVSCEGFNCSPTNLDCYESDKIDKKLLLKSVNHCKDAKWRPYLESLDAITRYYDSYPDNRKKGRCNILPRVLDNKLFLINSAGDFIPSNNCWIQNKMGNALKMDLLPKDTTWIKDVVREINDEGLPPPCQRLCCSKVEP